MSHFQGRCLARDLVLERALRLTVGTAVPIRIEGDWLGKAGAVTGHVSYVNPTVDAASRMVAVKIDVPNPNGAIRPGMVANVRR